ncbi:MAG: ABC transporter ATP-binding protein [Planctomycetota bacterium]|jgi:branched-chain amino acid transport system ATP-binding protein|nr:ABC transporter ATP-binding protein [Planctomycetota bacterium]
MAYLEIEGLSAAYGDTRVLWEVSLEVARGEVVAIVGSNGMGKTTIIRVVSGLVPSLGGVVRFDGREITNRPCRQILGAGIAHAPEGRQLFRDMTVYENLEMGAYGGEARKRLPESLERVYGWFPVLRDRRDQSAGTLSGGEQQMLTIARAYMSRPKLMLLDEPSLGLAPNVVDHILKVVKELAIGGMTVMLVEQDVRKALRISDRGYVIENGTVRMEGTAGALMNNEEVKKAYLGF